MKSTFTIAFMFFFCFIGSSQTFTVIEKSKSTAAIFDYSNPLSLVSLVYNNASLFVDNTFDEGRSFKIDAFKKSDLEQYTISKEELLQAETRGSQYLMYTGLGDDIALIKTSDNFDSWFENQKSLLEDVSIVPSKEYIKEMWDKAAIGNALMSSEQLFFDLRGIDLLILQNDTEDTLVHFAKKLKNYEKRVIVASISKRNLLDMLNFSVQVKAKKELTTAVWEALRDEQLKAYESCLKEYRDEPNLIFEQYSSYNGMVKINPIKEASIWERTLEFSTDLEPEKKMEYLHFGKLWTCKQERAEIFDFITMNGESIQIIKEQIATFKEYLSIYSPGDFLFSPSEYENIEHIWENTPIGEYLMSPLKTSYFWWDFEEPEMLIDYRFRETSETSGQLLTPVTLYFVKDLPSINKKVTTMRFELNDAYAQMEFLPLLEMNPKVKFVDLKWISLLNNPIGQCFENTLKDREKLGSYLLLSDDFLKKGYRITLY